MTEEEVKLLKEMQNNCKNESNYYTSPYLFLNLIYTTVGIYLICLIIESIRRLVMKKIDEKIDNIKYTIKV